ncbi:MAG TPA: hypothetical protein VHG72_13135 [Polyangia bacterium]|nr:hypothetical protein [Polyangia bacterium]
MNPVRAATLAACLTLSACVASVQSQIPPDIAATLVRNPMRRLDTDLLSLYYPAQRRDEAVRFAAHVEGCARQLEGRALVHNDIADRRLVIIFPEVTFNNAFTSPIAESYAPFALVPTYETIDAFSLEMGLPPDPGLIACHELTHYVHFQQVAGLAYVLNFIFGDVYTPQLGFDGWFDEGLAVYYETLLQPGVGRLAWPFWNGAFAAGVAGRRLRGGDMSQFNRDAFMGNQYLVGSHFIQFLAERYGERPLWDTIALQSRSVLFPLFLNDRFRKAYGRSLSSLIDAFADDVQARDPVIARPPEQHMLEAIGSNAVYGRGTDGSEAVIVAGHDTPPRIVVRGPDGRVRVARDLIDVVPPRTLVTADPSNAGPPSFTADGRFVYFTMLDQAPTFQVSRLMRLEVATGALRVVARDLRGGGGSINPDGTRYAYSRADGDHHDLAIRDLASGQTRILVRQPPGGFVSLPRFSADGQRLVASAFDGVRFSIRIFDARDGRELGGFGGAQAAVHDAAWADPTHVVYLGAERRDQGFQVYLGDLATGQSRRLTNAPYLAFEPQIVGDRLRFLNREGWRWTLDEQIVNVADPFPAPPAPAVGPPPSPLPPPVDVPPLRILGDAPYRQSDHLFALQLRGIDFATAGRSGVFASLVLAGGDRLQIHRWSLEGLYQINGPHTGGGGAFAYGNRQLAPFTMTESGLVLYYNDTLATQTGGVPGPSVTPRPFPLDKSERQANFVLSRDIYGAPSSLGFTFTADTQPNDPTVSVQQRQVAGPFLSVEYAGVESTPYTGPRRALVVTPSVALFPGGWNSANATLADVRMEVIGVVPLPLSRRHTLTLDLIGRDIFGLPAGDRWLQVGGGVSALTLDRTPNRPLPPDVTIDPLPTLRFVEPLRGYEDYPIATDRAAIGLAVYDYPLIIDWGSASTFDILPSFFLRQIDGQLFGSAAADGHGGGPHAAVGAAAIFKVAVWTVPFSFGYQIARRLADDDALVQIVTVTAD